MLAVTPLVIQPCALCAFVVSARSAEAMSQGLILHLVYADHAVIQ